MTFKLLFMTMLTACDGMTEHAQRVRTIQAAIDAGELDRAETLIQEALEQTPEELKVEKPRGELFFLMAEISYKQGRLAESVKLLDESTRLYPEYEAGYRMLGDLQHELGLEDEAIRSYEHVVRMKPENPEYRVKLCQIYLDLYQSDPARGACNEAYKLAPHDPMARAGAALVLARDGEADEAEQAAKAIDGLTPDQKSELMQRIRAARLEGPGRGRTDRIDQVATLDPGAVARARDKLSRHGRAPGADQEIPTLGEASPLTIPSPAGDLRAWTLVPETFNVSPAVVYLHRGFALTREDIDAAKPFVEAGFMVLFPTLRGEPGNPGEHELLLGERDDVRAAIAWLAKDPAVDPGRIFVFGDAEGGALAGLLVGSAAAIGSFAGVFPEQELVRYDPPFPLDDTEGRRARLWVHNLAAQGRTPHLAWLSARDPQADYAEELRTDAITLGAPVQVKLIPGPPEQARLEAIRAFINEIAAHPDWKLGAP